MDPQASAVLTLSSMFESTPLFKIAEIVRKNNADLEKCIEELLELPEIQQSISIIEPPVAKPTENNEREVALLRRISELEKENADLKESNARIEDEKKKSMIWVLEQMEQRTKEKDNTIEELKEQIDRLEVVIHRLQISVQQSRKQQKKFEILEQSKELLHSLSQNVTNATEKGWNKVKDEIKDFDEHNKILEKMKEIAAILKDEFGNIFGSKAREINPSEINSNVNEVPAVQEELSPEEFEEDQRVKEESLRSYIEEQSVHH